jgi:bifunctional non-homologous end joining protein LigD
MENWSPWTRKADPSFNLLQNYGSEKSRIVYYAFDIPVCTGNDLMRRPLSERREILRSVIRAEGHVGISEASDRPLAEMIKFTQAHGLEGIVAKRADSSYQPGLRTGAWSKHRFNRSQEFVIGGYVPSHLGIDSLVVGVYRDKNLYYTARVRAGFIPSSRRQVFEAIKHLTTTKCPFANLPQKEPGRWGKGLTAEKMTQCAWLLCRIRHSSHYVECRTMPHAFGLEQSACNFCGYGPDSYTA